jgi:hypothetical protein
MHRRWYHDPASPFTVSLSVFRVSYIFPFSVSLHFSISVLRFICSSNYMINDCVIFFLYFIFVYLFYSRRILIGHISELRFEEAFVTGWLG